MSVSCKIPEIEGVEEIECKWSSERLSTICFQLVNSGRTGWRMSLPWVIP